MNKRKLGEGIYWLGALDWERRLFDSLIALPDGTTYNAYLVEGTDKVALLDTVDPAKTELLLTQLADVRRLDYIISHHAEQDHSGSLPAVLARFPQAKVVCTPRAKEMLIDLLLLSEDVFLTVEDGQELPLGGKTLKFVYTPWVHWPETMVTYLKEDRFLFSCDFFGSHLATSDLLVKDECRAAESAKRYFAEIMAPFRPQIEKNLAKLADLPIDLIAPSHGQVYGRPSFIVDLYREWVTGPPRNLVLLAYVTMHGSTKKMAERLAASLADQGVRVELFDLAVTDLGKLAMALLDAGTIVLATCTVLTGPHPLATNAAVLANALRPKARLAAVIGSYGWGGKAAETLVSLLPNLKAEILDPILCKGYPREADFQALEALAALIARKHQEFGLV